MAVSIGDRVIVNQLPVGMSEGLPVEDARFISDVIGKEAVVSDRIDAELIEICIEDPETSSIHFITLSETMVSKKTG